MPIANGIVIENLAAGQSIEQVRCCEGWSHPTRPFVLVPLQVWSLMYMVRDILDLHHVGGQGVRTSDETSGCLACLSLYVAIFPESSESIDTGGSVEGLADVDAGDVMDVLDG